MPLLKQLLFILFCIAFISCNNFEDSLSKVTWIGGEIVNPKMDYVLFSKDNNVIDTIPLSKDNFFLYRVDSLTSGLYSFQHYEYQIIYLKPGDSLMLRVNTVDFDESLAFSGRGAERNNLLMDFFLMNEEETKLMPHFYQLPPKEFQKKIDSLKSIRMALYNEFVEKNSSDEDFKEVAKANTDYDSYIKMELYTSANQGNNNIANEKDFPTNFYDYRNKIDFGNENLRNYYPYYRFLNRYFDNIAYQKYQRDSDFDRYSFIHNFNKIKSIDSLITNDSLKFNLIRTNVIQYLLNGKDAEKGAEIVSLFSKINTNQTCITEIEDLSKATMLLAPGNTIPNVFLLSTDNTIKDLHTILKKPTVLFFWSSQSIMHFKNIHAKAAELNSKYPEYDFIGINTDTHFKKWREIVKKSGYHLANEYQFDNIREAEKKLIINSANKAMILTKEGIIQEGNTSLFNQNIEALLLGYLNK